MMRWEASRASGASAGFAFACILLCTSPADTAGGALTTQLTTTPTTTTVITLDPCRGVDGPTAAFPSEVSDSEGNVFVMMLVVEGTAGLNVLFVDRGRWMQRMS